MARVRTEEQGRILKKERTPPFIIAEPRGQGNGENTRPDLSALRGECHSVNQYFFYTGTPYGGQPLIATLGANIDNTYRGRYTKNGLESDTAEHVKP